MNNDETGDDCHTAKLNWNTVKEIRELYATGSYSQSQLAKIYGVTQTPISLIIRNKTWVE